MSLFAHRLRITPTVLNRPLAGIDLSPTEVKAVRLQRTRSGFVLSKFARAALPETAFVNGDIADPKAVTDAILAVAREAGITAAHVALLESKAYLFTTAVAGATKAQWHTSAEQHLEQLIPLPPPSITFDLVPVGPPGQQGTPVIGVGSTHTTVDAWVSVFDAAGVTVRGIETESFAAARALVPFGESAAVLIVDVGRTTTKVCVVTGGIPRFTTTIGIGGHAITLAIQKYFGVSEEEARKIKTEKGIVASLGNEECLAAMLSTLSALRDEVMTQLTYWQAKAAAGGGAERVSRAVLTGGNAPIRGFQEYLENALQVPVGLGNVFTNLASPEKVLPGVSYEESLAYTTAIGLALYAA